MESRAAERGKSASPSAVPEDRYAGGPAMDWSMQVKEHSAEPATAAEGDARAGESTPERMHMLPVKASMGLDSTTCTKSELVAST